MSSYTNHVKTLYNAVQTVVNEYCLRFPVCKIQIYEQVQFWVKYHIEKRTLGTVRTVFVHVLAYVEDVPEV